MVDFLEAPGHAVRARRWLVRLLRRPAGRPAAWPLAGRANCSTSTSSANGSRGCRCIPAWRCRWVRKISRRCSSPRRRWRARRWRCASAGACSRTSCSVATCAAAARPSRVACCRLRCARSCRFVPEMAVRDFVVENGRVTGVIAVSDGREVRIQARDGVLINAGGFSRNREMRERWQPKPNAWQWTNANPGDTGEMIEAAMRLGAAVDCMNEAWWVITSLGPDESLPEGAVNPEGVADSVHAPPRPVAAAPDHGRPGRPPFLRRVGRLHGDRPAPLCAARGDRQGRSGVGDPRSPPSRQLSVGHRAARQDTAILARQRLHEEGRHARGTRATVRHRLGGSQRPRSRNSTGIAAPASIPSSIAADARSIARTVTRRSSRTRTSATIEQGPFYAVAMYPGDVGTAGGIVTDEHARVLREDGSVIEGLYATGNSTASVVGRCYPGAGASIGASFVFGYRAAQHAAKSARTAGARRRPGGSSMSSVPSKRDTGRPVSPHDARQAERRALSCHDQGRQDRRAVLLAARAGSDPGRGVGQPARHRLHLHDLPRHSRHAREGRADEAALGRDRGQGDGHVQGQGRPDAHHASGEWRHGDDRHRRQFHADRQWPRARGAGAQAKIA